MTTALTILVGVTFLITSGVKLLGVRQSLEIRDHLGLTAGLWKQIGLLESAGAVGTLLGLWIDLLGTMALVGLLLLMIGAIASRVRVKDGLWAIAMDIAVLTLVGVTLALHAS